MRAIVATPSAVSLTFGCDTLASLTKPDFARLAASRISWRGGYIDHVTADELAAQLAAGILFSPFTYALEFDTHTISKLVQLGIPRGVTMWFDLERISAALDPTTITTKINAWARSVQTASFEAGLYVGAGAPLNEDQLYGLAVTRYAHSVSNVPNVARRGYCVRQIRPNDVIVDGVDVDIDIVEPDYLGGLPTFVGA